MCAIYSTIQNTIAGEYFFKNETAFFGNKVGMITYLPISQILGSESETFIINLRPKNNFRSWHIPTK